MKRFAGILFGGAALMAGSQSFAGIAPPSQASASIDRNAVLADSAVCTVVIKTSIEASQVLAAGNPIDGLSSMPATCNGNMMMQLVVGGGVRQMLVTGYRLIGVSHQVTALATSPSGKAELLISAVFALERPTTVIVRGAR